MDLEVPGGTQGNLEGFTPRGGSGRPGAIWARGPQAGAGTLDPEPRLGPLTRRGTAPWVPMGTAWTALGEACQTP